MKILVADDDTVNRSLVKNILEKLGHEVIECSDGKDVMGHLFKGDLPQLIFLDWMMPSIDGISVCVKIRERADLPYTHIVMMTSKNEPTDIIEGLRAGANDYLTKPLNLEEFHSRLQIGIQMVDLNQLVLKQRLQIISASKMAVLGEMAANIAHEINNPLAIISGYTQILQSNLNKAAEGLVELNFAEQAKIYSIIVETTTKISKIVRSLKAFASDGENEPVETVMLKDVVDSALALCSSKLKNHNIKLEVEPESIPFFVPGQATQLSQVLINLIDNAYLSINEKKDKWIRIEAAEDTQNVMLSVTDSGNGIPEHIRSKIMQPFFTTRPFGKGTGLGLSVSKGIIESHHGTLTLDENCLNTRFVITIPKSRKIAA